MQRQLEPEVMDTPAEAEAYDRMDHAEVNRLFVADLLAAVGTLEQGISIVDLGTGTALIPIELCRRSCHARVTAIDAAASMLAVAERNVAQAGLEGRIELSLADAKVFAGPPFDVVMSNSLVHHLPDPSVFFEQAHQLAGHGGLIFVRDLLRPADEQQWQRLVDTYAGDAKPDQRQMFADSLRAALTLDEVRDLVGRHGHSPETVAATSDRHWTWVARRGE